MRSYFQLLLLLCLAVSYSGSAGVQPALRPGQQLPALHPHQGQSEWSPLFPLLLLVSVCLAPSSPGAMGWKRRGRWQRLLPQETQPSPAAPHVGLGGLWGFYSHGSGRSVGLFLAWVWFFIPSWHPRPLRAEREALGLLNTFSLYWVASWVAASLSWLCLRRVYALCFLYYLLGLKTNGLEWPGGSLCQTASLARSQQGEALPNLGTFGAGGGAEVSRSPLRSLPCQPSSPCFLHAVALCCYFTREVSLKSDDACRCSPVAEEQLILQTGICLGVEGSSRGGDAVKASQNTWRKI